MARPSLVILGSGYTARYLLPLAGRRYAQVFATSRNPARHLAHLPFEQRVRFDLTVPNSWNNVPEGADLLWCFPAEPLNLVQRFAEVARASAHRIVVLGSTSAYDTGSSTEYPPPWIDETAPVDLTKPRVQGEEFLRTACGAILLRVAGIYGPGRNPLDWIRRGRVGPSRKYVNLIHAEDLAVGCLAALRHGVAGAAYNVSDGTPRTWKEICETAERRWDIRPFAPTDALPTGKRLSNERFLALLASDHVSIRHTDLYEALAQIHKGAFSETAP